MSTSRATGRLGSLTGGAPTLPLLVLFGLNLVDEFDRVAFGVLTPEIRSTFGLSDGGIVAIGSLAAVFALLGALPIGYLADRVGRVRLSAVAALVWGSMTVLTGAAPVLAVLFVARLGAGLGRIVNEPVHASLLADYYRAPSHPRVFAFHRLANPIGLTSALVIGLLGSIWDWRAVFIVLAVPTFLLVGTLLRLREPARGESVDRELAEEAAAAESVSFGEARRQLFAVRTLRRVWVGIFLLGIGAISLNQLVTLFFEKEYGYGPTGRGVVAFLSGAGVVVGLFVGQRLAAAAIAAGRPDQLARYNGLSFVGLGLGLVAMAVAPWAPLSAVLVLVASVGLGAYQPNYFPLVGLVCPPRVRSQGFAWAILFLGCGGLLSPVIASIGDSDAGYRVAVAVLAALLVAGGVLAYTAFRFVAHDIAQAEATLETAVRLRRELAESGAHALLTCRGVDVAYDSVQVLFGVDLDIREGEIVALLGTNGAGKSTLLKAITGIVDPIGGAIFFGGRDITHADAVQSTKLGIVQMPGGKGVFPTLTVAEHFTAAAWLFAGDTARVQAATEEVLDRFPRLRERWDQLGGDLSGGEQQMLALGMAFIARPRLLMIDELSLGLAPAIVEQLLDMVRHINRQGATVVVVEQSVNVALTLADRAYFLEKGQVRFSGPTADLLERDDILRSVFLEGAGARDGSPRGPSPGAGDGGDVDRSVPPILSASSLGKSFGGIRAVDDVTFDLWPGEILGLIGPNGAGKTTVFDLVSGFLLPDRGVVRFEGVDVSSWSPDRRARAGLGRSFQDARIFPSLTVAENLAMGLERHLEVRDHVAAALGLPASRQQEDHVAWTVHDLVELMNLGAFRDKFVGELSTGSRRIVDLAMAIAHDPSVLILDEPSSGIAQRETEALGPLLRRIRAETGCAMLVIEHDMPLITEISDRMLALELGRVIADGSPRSVVTDAGVVASYLGGDAAVVHRSGTVAGGARRRREPLRA
jgi:ABC-type branched-subunit amino acid transport system ATPase component/predicted MFS family arabinose efflux permease